MDRLAIALVVICGALAAHAADPYDPQMGTMNAPESVSETQAHPAINENARPRQSDVATEVITAKTPKWETEPSPSMPALLPKCPSTITAAIACTLPDGTTVAYDKDGYMVVPRR